MRVFTHYYPIRDNQSFIWRTLLQFGESWDIMGSVVLECLNKYIYLDKTIVSVPIRIRLRDFDTVDSMEDKWYACNPDEEMKAISKMFAMRCEYQGVPFKGIVQIYSLFDISTAVYFNKKNERFRNFKIQEKILQYDIESLRPPIYIGTTPKPLIAGFDLIEVFFNRAIELGTKYLNKDYWKNEFLNPLTLMYGVKANDPKAVSILEQFIRE